MNKIKTNKKKSTEEFINELFEIHNNKIVALEKYKGIDTKIFFKCNVCSHEWNTSPYLLLKGCGCPCCAGRTCVEDINSIYKLRPDLVKYFKNVLDAKNNTIKSAEDVECICPNCGYEKKIKIYNLSNYGFKCDCCSDTISMPNKFTAILLRKLNISFQLEKTFKWAKDKRYDVFIPNLNGESIIVENHGLQHENGAFKSLGGNDELQEKENDRFKKEVALNNDIDRYIEIHYYHVNNTLENFKKSIFESDFCNLFDLSNVNWENIWEECSKSLVIQVWNIWNSINKNKRSTVKIGELLGLDRKTIARYLKIGVEVGKVDYNPIEERKSGKGMFGDKHSNSKKVVCLNTGEIFSSVSEANRKYNTSVTNSCNNKLKSSGKLNDGTKLVWRYYDDYIKMLPEEIDNYIIIANKKHDIQTNNFKPIICLNTKEVFYNKEGLMKKYNVSRYDRIVECCKGKTYSHGSISVEDATKLSWRYYEDYIKMSSNEIIKIVERANSPIKGDNHYKIKKIICLNTKEVFTGQIEASNYYGIKSYNNISMCCRGERKYCGTLPNGEKLQWKYLEDYKNESLLQNT